MSKPAGILGLALTMVSIDEIEDFIEFLNDNYKQETQMTPEQIKAEKLKRKEKRKKLEAKEKLAASQKAHLKRKQQAKAAAKERTQLHQDIDEKGQTRWFQDNGGIGPALRSPLLKVAGFKKALQVAQKQAREAAELKRGSVDLAQAPNEVQDVIAYPREETVAENPVLTDGAAR